MCAVAQVGTWQLIHFACTFSPDSFFFCRSSEQAQGSPLELVEVMGEKGVNVAASDWLIMFLRQYYIVLLVALI